jgi:galactose-1-phosphate uridylyltransferase
MYKYTHRHKQSLTCSYMWTYMCGGKELDGGSSRHEHSQLVVLAETFPKVIAETFPKVLRRNLPTLSWLSWLRHGLFLLTTRVGREALHS